MIRQIGVCLSIESTEDAGVFVLPFCLQMVSDNIPRQHKPERIQATAFSGFAPHQAAISGVCPSEILTHNVRGGSVPCGWVTHTPMDIQQLDAPTPTADGFEIYRRGEVFWNETAPSPPAGSLDRTPLPHATWTGARLPDASGRPRRLGRP